MAAENGKMQREMLDGGEEADVGPSVELADEEAMVGPSVTLADDDAMVGALPPAAKKRKVRQVGGFAVVLYMRHKASVSAICVCSDSSAGADAQMQYK